MFVAVADADPHNSNRGFFFAHMGWLLCRKHPDVKIKGAGVDMSDIWSDPIVRFQRRFYIPLLFLIWFAFPMWVPYYFWNESLWNAFQGCVVFRYVWVLHCTWLVNSAAHLWGEKPYDKKIGPCENDSVVYFAFGEGYHNYHHTFPWDYSTSEFGWRVNFNLTTLIIDFFAWIGWAYDLKKVPPEMIRKRQERSGELKAQFKRPTRWTDWFFGVSITSSSLWISFLCRWIILYGLGIKYHWNGLCHPIVAE